MAAAATMGKMTMEHNMGIITVCGGTGNRKIVSFLHGKTVPPRIFFSPQAEVFSEGSLYPRGSSLRTSEARAGN